MVLWARPFLAVFLAGCLDFDVFSVEDGGASEGGAATGGANAGGTAAGGQSAGAGGAGGAGGGPVELGPCFDGQPLSDDFDGGSQLSWGISNVSFTSDHAELRFVDQSVTYMGLFTSPGVLASCYFQIEITDADPGTLYMLFRGQNPDTETFGLYLDGGVPTGQLLPDDPSLPLEDDSALPTGVLRIGEDAGTYFIHTAPSPAGPWTVRYETTSAPAWLSSPGTFVLGAYGGTQGDSIVVDDFNIP